MENVKVQRGFPAAKPRKRHGFRISQAVLIFVIFALLIVMIYPLAMALWNAFKSDYVYDLSKWYPTLPLRLSNLGDAFSEVWRYVLNTIIVGVVGVSLQLFIASLASYAFARMEFPGRKIFFSMVIVLMMVPSVLTLVPSFMLYKSMGLLDNLLVLILPMATGGCVGAVFLLNSFFRGIPKDIFEAARIDGASEFQCFVRMAVPLCIPILGTIMIMSLVACWNDYLWPMITMTQNFDNLTISAGLVLVFEKEHSTNMPLNFSGYLIASIPLILLFVFANRYYVQGLISSSIKL